MTSDEVIHSHTRQDAKSFTRIMENRMSFLNLFFIPSKVRAYYLLEYTRILLFLLVTKCKNYAVKTSHRKNISHNQRVAHEESLRTIDSFGQIFTPSK